jgi:hypothetical protein
MGVFRRHLAAVTWLILSAQTLVLALGTARVCWEGNHTHGGVPAPHCAMHHQTGSDAPSMHHGSHDHHATASETVADSGASMTCRCSNDVIPLDFGQTAFVLVSASWTAVLSVAILDRQSDPPVVDVLFSPPSPPPR